jgi:uncharacterized membrane protein
MSGNDDKRHHTTNRISAILVIIFGWVLAYWFWPSELNMPGAAMSGIGAAVIAIGAIALAALVWE